MTRFFVLFAPGCIALVCTAGVSLAQDFRLIGITGNQGSPNDETLYEIDVAAGTVTPLIKLPFVPDTDSIAFNPRDGLLYRTSGAGSYSNDPTSNGFRDNHFLESIDVLGGSLAQTAIFNANSEQFGLPAPRPTWVLPSERRADNQTGSEFRIQGPNEYHSLRDFTWSERECSFYGADEDGIFELTAAGDSTFIGQPGGQPKGITFATIAGERRLYLSDRNSPELWVIDPATGQHVGPPVMVKDPTNPEAFVFGLLSLVEIPGEPLLYAIRNTPGNPNSRQLLIVDPASGESVSVLSLGVHMADLALIFEPPASGDINLDKRVDRLDAAAFAQYFGVAAGATWETGDFDCDGATTLADLALLQANIEPSAGLPTASAAVPEPSTETLALMFIGGSFVVARRRRVDGVVV